MSGTKPTPGPWHITDWRDGSGPVLRLAIENGGTAGGTVTCVLNAMIPECEANARLIVRAVNCHADLVDGCNALLGLFQLLCARDDAPAWLKDAFETSHRVTEARAALAKAGEVE